MPAFTPEQFIKEEEFPEGAVAPDTRLFISEAGALTQFGALIEILQPGSSSSIKHWHSAEDEMVYVLSGEITLVEGNQATLLKAGDAATFRAGVPLGHTFMNRSAQPTRCLVVGTRAPVDQITYPDHDRVLVRERASDSNVWTDFAGRPADSPYR